MYGYNMQYGGASFDGAQFGLPFAKGQRKRLNVVAILVSLFLPWLLFCSTLAVLTFSLHYTQPYVAYVLVALAFLVGVGLPGLLARDAWKRKLIDPTYQPSWYLFLFATCSVAFIAAAVVGEQIYSTSMQNYYNLEHLASYREVDANSAVGQQFMDAGRIEFQESTEVDVSRSMGFKNHDIYCVAPMVTRSSSTTPTSVDFWAVGKNCCSGLAADFHCSGFAKRGTSGGIRLMHDEDRSFYRLAVQQAEATYQITAAHPLFFEWVQNPDDAMNAVAQTGQQNYFLSICIYFAFQIFLTFGATIIFSKMVHY